MLQVNEDGACSFYMSGAIIRDKMKTLIVSGPQ